MKQGLILKLLFKSVANWESLSLSVIPCWLYSVISSGSSPIHQCNNSPLFLLRLIQWSETMIKTSLGWMENPYSCCQLWMSNINFLRQVFPALTIWWLIIQTVPISEDIRKCRGVSPEESISSGLMLLAWLKLTKVCSIRRANAFPIWCSLIPWLCTVG